MINFSAEEIALAKSSRSGRSGRILALGSTAVLAAAGAGPLVLLTSSAASANATLVVDNLGDSGAGSLREAMNAANVSPGADVITFTAGATGTISLLSHLPELTEGVDIQGPGASVLTIDGGWTAAGGPTSGHMVFNIEDEPGSVAPWTISGLTITGGNNGGGGGAISIYNSVGAPVNIHDVVMTDNFASRGGGALFLVGNGNVEITNSAITGNTTLGGGGALYADTESHSTLTITDSVITDNSSASDGGALYLDTDGGNITITGTTIANNASGSDGGAIMVNDLYTEGSLTITNSVISSNTAVSTGGALYSTTEDGSIFILNSTISDNIAGTHGGALYLGATGEGEVVIANSTISGNSAGLTAGGIYAADGAKLNLTQATVTNNSAGAGDAASVGGILTANGYLGPNAINELREAKVKDKDEDNKSDNDSNRAGGRVSSLERDGVAGQITSDLTIVGSIVAGNSGFDLEAKSFSSPVVDADHSVLGEIGANVTITDGGGTQIGVSDPMLGVLADNGGPTRTHALLAGSPAIDAGPDPVPTFAGNEFDQRGAGYDRIVFGFADAGAFEVQTPEPTPVPEPVAPAFTG